jgi:MoaA/NifB/PqqE/SkfB family radical SAM enzyme
MRQLSIHLTDLCNSRCSFCVVGSPLVKSDSVRMDDVVAFLLDNAGGEFESVNLHGGEPTIHPRLLDLLDLAQALGYAEVQIQTNGRRLKDPAFVAELAARGVRLFIVSLHGASAVLHDELTQAPGGFVETIRGIENAKAAGIRVRTNTVITTQNLVELDALVRLCGELGVDHVNLSNLHPVGSGYFALDSMAPSAAQLRSHVDAAVRYLEDAGRRVTLEGFPLCVIAPHERLAIEDGTREIRMLYQGRVLDDYDGFMDEECREYGPPCEGCAVRTACGGVYKEYAERRGWSEFGWSADMVSQRA